MRKTMGDRFYQQQLAATGNCPGATKSQTKRKRKMAWTDEKKAAVVEAYEQANPTPENSMEIVKEIADEHDESPNGVRMILTKAGVYVKKTPAASSSATKASTGGSTRVSKAGAQEALIAALSDAGQEVDEEIVSKLTGKAAQYFAAVIAAVTK
jgi:transposase-like protein